MEAVRHNSATVLGDLCAAYPWIRSVTPGTGNVTAYVEPKGAALRFGFVAVADKRPDEVTITVCVSPSVARAILEGLRGQLDKEGLL